MILSVRVRAFLKQILSTSSCVFCLRIPSITRGPFISANLPPNLASLDKCTLSYGNESVAGHVKGEHEEKDSVHSYVRIQKRFALSLLLFPTEIISGIYKSVSPVNYVYRILITLPLEQ